MQGTFDYYTVKTVMDSIEIDDIGNFVLETIDDKYQIYYLYVETHDGRTVIFQYGPAEPDFPILPTSCSCSYMRIDYSDSKVNKIISSYFKAHNFTQARIIDKEEMFPNCINIIDYVKSSKDFQ